MTGPIFQREKLSQSNLAAPQSFLLDPVGSGPESAAGACPMSHVPALPLSASPGPDSPASGHACLREAKRGNVGIWGNWQSWEKSNILSLSN